MVGAALWTSIHIITPAYMRVNHRFCWPYGVFQHFCNGYKSRKYDFKDTFWTLCVKRGFFVHVVFMENCIVTFFSASASFLGDLKHYMNAEKLFFIYCLFSAVFAMKIETVILCFEFLIPSLLHTTSPKVTNASLFQSYQLASFNIKKCRFNLGKWMSKLTPYYQFLLQARYPVQ